MSRVSDQQLSMRLPSAGGALRVAISASRELEPGFRAAIIEAAGLFRLDVQFAGDTLRTVVRNLSPGELELLDRGAGPERGRSVRRGDTSGLEPSLAPLRFRLGAGSEQVAVSVILATVRVPARGTVRVTAQAILRQGEH